MGDPKEDEICGLASCGNLQAAATLAIRTYGAELFGFLISLHRNEADADDVFAAAAERVWQSLGEFRWECSLRTWMYAVCRNESLRFHDRLKRREGKCAAESAASEIAAQVRTATLPYLKTAVRTAFTELRETLDAEDRTILVLRLDRGLAWDELARVLGDEKESASEEVLKRESARLRKRFEAIKRRLTILARERGLLETQ
ncbi:MAG TPA: sigma-70 family RNA polymerase sigma factor [Polyangiaceae bacterium]|jgi:RNA polymerase sigma-70 factor (ECF subfamily)|nr:sigma-70 family RNA polymerase sigma factor [Polyangiaceae bacterium]